MFSPFHAKNCQNIDHKEDTKEWEVFLNTEVEEVQSTLQFSTSVEVRPGNVTIVCLLVCPCVYNAKVTENCSKDFANFWSEVRYRYSEGSHRALFSKKILNDPKF